jgi:hypothetical protein
MQRTQKPRWASLDAIEVVGAADSEAAWEVSIAIIGGGAADSLAMAAAVGSNRRWGG